MNEIKIDNKKQTKYKRWSFRLFIYFIILNLTSFYITVNYSNGIDDMEEFIQNLNVISIIANLILLAGIVFTVLSIAKKEKKNYQYYVSIIVYPLFILFTIMTFL